MDEEQNETQLLDLPPEQTCKLMMQLIDAEAYRTKSLHCLVTNQNTLTIKDRSYFILSPYEKCRISHNWLIGRYAEHTYFKDQQKHLPWLVLTKTHIWFSRDNYINAYRRMKKVANVPEHHIGIQFNDADVFKFKVKGNRIFIGFRNGTLLTDSFLVQNGRKIINNAHFSDVLCVDFDDRFYISSSKDGSLHAWAMDPVENNLALRKTYHLYDVIWSCAISPQNNSMFAAGCSGNRGIYPLNIFDVNNANSMPFIKFKEPFKRGAGVLDMHWLDENLILTCGYDSCVKKWDIRTGECVNRWEDPHDSALYCLSCDDCYTFICGTQNNGRVVLWDMRAKNYKQMYYLKTAKHRSSPVYSVAFDACELYAATDTCLNVLNFTGKTGYIRNYSNLYSYNLS